MRKLLIAVMIAAVSTAGFTAGKTESGNQLPEKIEITDSTGNTVVLDKIPERITFAGRASIMVADALYMFPGASEKIVGVGFTNQGRGNFTSIVDPAYSDKVFLDYSAGVEQIAGTKPDLVIMKNYLKKKLGSPVEQLGIPVVYMGLETPEQYETDFRVIGKIFNDPGRAEEIIGFYRDLKKRITSKTDKLDNHPRVLFIYHSSKGGETAFNVPPKEWIQTRMVEMAGGLPVWAGEVSGRGWIKVSFEQVAVWNPDYIFVAAYKQDEKEVVKKLLASEKWKDLKAVKAGKVYSFPVDFYSWDQPDSRWILGTVWLASVMHPDLFPGLNIQNITKEFYKELYFMSDSVYNREIKSKLGW